MLGLARVVLRLGRNPDHGFPDGADDYGYVLIAPLDAEGRLDEALWRTRRKECTILRFHPDEPKADGVLTHRGDTWFFHYDEPSEGGDEPLFRLSAHRLLPGEYVTVREEDGDVLTFKVTEMTRM